MASRRRNRRRKAASGRSVVVVGGLSVAGVAALGLTFSAPKAPPEYRSPVDVVPAAANGSARASAPAPLPTESESTGAFAPAAEVIDEVGSTGTVAVVLGDGLSATTGQNSSFACAAVVRRGWRCRSFAAAGSGYLSRGGDGTYLDQLARAGSVEDVGLVVVTGGGVDRAASAAAAGSAADQLVARALYTFPAATIVLVPPFDTGAGAGAGGGKGGTAISDALRAAADGREVRFADPAGWFRDVPAVLAGDGRSLAPKAATVAAQRLAAALPAAAAAG